MTLLRLLPASVLAVALAVAAQAQGTVAAGTVQQGAQQTQQFEQLQRQLQRRGDPTHPEIAHPGAAPAPGAPAGPSFHLNHIATNASAILTPAQIASVTDRYRNREVTLADLQRAVVELNRLYAKQGIITARAVLPRQQVENGVVHIELIEARLDRIAIVGARGTLPSFFLSRIHARPGQLLRLDALRHDLILLNNGNGLQARALLRPGPRFGTTDLVVEVQEPEPLAPSFDDVGRASVGLRRLGLNASDASVLGDQDALSLNTSWATGTLSEAASYSVPLTAGGTRLTVGADYAGIRILSGQLQTLGITGRSVDASVGVSRPLVAREGFLFTGSAALRVMKTSTDSAGVALSQQFVQAGELGGTLQGFDRGGAWIASGLLDFGTLDVAGRHWFAKDSVSLVRQETMGGGVTGLLRFTGQSRLRAPSAGLPLVEQLQLGGISTVRGYPEGWQIGDVGYALTTEVDYPLPLRQYFFGGWFSRGLEGSVFLDHGGIFGLPGAHSGPHATPRDLYLTSAGLGVVFNAPYLAGRLDWAAPLENRAGLPKVGFDFYLQPRPPTSWLAFWRKRG
ncbi:MAG TPA: POTRA domain-containing protein [Terriglobales bacterium]|nr:POTRA domain-containing protein [Terriglobales bacterium]